ncbi:AAA family ATPase [Thalassobacillus devorans]|nr:P-loop NTPase [Thalassobacillus devorans]
MEHQQAIDSGFENKVVAVCSATGGMGRTTIAVNLAALAAKNKKKVTILDGDLQFGDAAMALDMKGENTIQHIVEKHDLANSQNYCLKHESGVQLLAAPTRPEYADLITPDSLVRILKETASRAQLLLVDVQAGLTEHNIQLLEQVDRILVVTTPGMAALKNTKLMIETLDALGWKDKASVIVNKSTGPTLMDVHDITELLQVEEAFYLPDEDKHVPLAFDRGIPVVISHPKLPFSKELAKINEHLFPPALSETTEHITLSRRLIKKFKGLRGKDDEFISKTAIKTSRGS